MNILKFNVLDLVPIVNHAVDSKDHIPTKEQLKNHVTIPPGLLLIKKTGFNPFEKKGIYLQSNGKNNFPLRVFAEGCDPDKDKNWWRTSQNIGGRSHFVKFLDFDCSRFAYKHQCHQLIIEIKGDSIELKREMMLAGARKP